MSGNVTIELTRNVYKIYPFDFSRWNKEKHIAEGTAPNLEKSFKVFENFMGHCRYKDTLELCDRKNKTLYIPIGADIEFIKQKLDGDCCSYQIIDNSNEFIKPRDSSFEIDEKYQLRDQNQAESIDFLTSERLFHSKMLALSTGTGKTFCAIVAAFKLKVPILIVSETLSDQWCEKIIEYTNQSCTIENKSIKLIKGTSNFIEMLNNKKASHANFYIATSSTLYMAIEKYGEKMVNDVCDYIGLGITCFDEYHMHWKQNVKIDMTIRTYMTWYLTATPSRSNQQEKSLFYKITKHIPSYGSKTFFDRVDINLICVDYKTDPIDYEIQRCFTSKGFSGVLYWNYIFNKFDRTMYMCGLIKIIIDNILEKEPNAKIVIYLAKLEHIDRIKHEFEKMYNNINFGNYTTEVEKKRKRYEINKNVIFTTIGSGGVGLDVEDLQCVISLIPFSSDITATQLIGRLRNIKDETGKPKELYFYDCIDTAFNSMKYQRDKRMVIYRPKAKSIENITITERDALEYLK